MLQKEIFEEIALKTWCYIKTYLNTYLLYKIKETFNKTKNYFLNSLIETIKEDVKLFLPNAVIKIEEFLSSETYEIKEKALIEYLYNKINLPIILKPFKFLLKNFIKEKIKELVSASLVKLKKLNEII